MESQVYDQPPPYSEVISTIPPGPGPSLSTNITSNMTSTRIYPNQNNIPEGYQQQLFQQQPYQGHSKPIAPPSPHIVFAQNYGSMGSGPQVMPTEIIVIGGCPACRIGVLEDDYPCLGLACALLFFPIGILCCLAMKQKRCTTCGAEFSI